MHPYGFKNTSCHNGMRSRYSRVSKTCWKLRTRPSNAFSLCPWDNAWLPAGWMQWPLQFRQWKGALHVESTHIVQKHNALGTAGAGWGIVLSSLRPAKTLLVCTIKAKSMGLPWGVPATTSEWHSTQEWWVRWLWISTYTITNLSCNKGEVKVSTGRAQEEQGGLHACLFHSHCWHLGWECPRKCWGKLLPKPLRASVTQRRVQLAGKKLSTGPSLLIYPEKNQLQKTEIISVVPFGRCWSLWNVCKIRFLHLWGWVETKSLLQFMSFA